VQRLQKQAERIGEWLKAHESKYGTTGKEISSNLTDNDSATMKTAHGVIQGYNSQALIDGRHQVIVPAQAFGRGQDHAHGPPMLDGALENLQRLGHGAECLAGKVESELGRKIYPQRFAVAEPVFANIRTHKRLDRFTLRGKTKVNIQWLLYCMVHNLEKIANYGST
jgi:hypothetical protein